MLKLPKHISIYSSIINKFMKHSFIKQFLYGGVLLAPAFLLTGCIDNSYGDLDDIDLTMGLGSDGLGVKLGNTEKIMLDDILSVDESVKLDGNNLYYLVENGTTDFEVNIDPLTVDLDIPALKMRMNVLSYDDVKSQFETFFPGIPVPEGQPIPIKKGSDFIPTGLAESKETESTFTVKDISHDIKQINWISFNSTEVTLRLHEYKSDNVKFGIEELKNVVITLPEILHVTDYSSDRWTYDAETHTLTQNGDLKLQNGDLTICKVTVDRADVNTTIGVDNSFTVNSDITMKGDVDFFVTQDFDMMPGDYVTVELEFVHDDKLYIREVNGRFNPVVNPDITTIDVFDGLPDFLQDKNVTISVSNPTLKFTSDLRNIPVGFNFGAKLTSVKQGEDAFRNPVTLPQVSIDDHQFSTVYYHQGSAPYDPEVTEIPAYAVKKQVGNLSSLIEKLPDYIEVDLGGNQIQVQQDKDFTIQMGVPYTASAAYDIYVPFEFDSKLTIVYKDSTNSIGEDLEDYAAHGLRVSAKVQNTIPLGLKLKIEAHDADNRLISGVDFSEVSIKPGTGSVDRPVEAVLTVDGTLSDPYLLGRIDHLVFDITADASQNGEEVRQLLSTQYVRLADIRVRLKGQVIANFN